MLVVGEQGAEKECFQIQVLMKDYKDKNVYSGITCTNVDVMFTVKNV